MKMKPEDEAKWLERMRSPCRPIRDGNSPFYDDPSDVGAHIRNNLHNIQAGQGVITDFTLPYIEDEAIARIRKRTSFRPVVEPDKRKEPELWRSRWVAEVLREEHQLFGIDSIGQAAIRVLITASRLRNAIAAADSQLIAAQSILLCCELFEGGYMLASEANHKIAKKAKPFISSQGRRKLDSKTKLYEDYAERYPGDNKKAVEELRRACPAVDDGTSPFYWSDRTLIDRKLGKAIHIDDMRAQLQKARERMKKRAAKQG